MAGARAEHVPWIPFSTDEGSLVAGLGLGLAVMMWNYSGWDNPSTMLGETRAPATAYRRALFVALPIIVLAYLLPVAAGLSVSEDWAEWESGHLPVVAEAVGGPVLGSLVTRARCSPRRGSSSRASSPTRGCPSSWRRSGSCPRSSPA